MPLTKGQRNELHQKYANLIGGVDEDGVEHKLAPTEEARDLKRARELFAVLDTDKKHSMWEFVNGRRLNEFINAGRYKIEYIGKNKDVLGNKKARNIMLEQIKQQVAGRKAKNEKAGIFEPEDHYENLLKERTDVLNARFKQYDDSKKE